jgi:hypothetical protein
MKIPNLRTAPLGLAFAVAIAPIDYGKADPSSTFVIAAAAGYGVEDCLGEGGECGRVVADAWCEAHGRGAALTFGQKNEPAGSSTGSGPYFITCGE